MFSRHFPILTWASTYRRDTFSADAIAAIIVTIMLIPQSLAYALLAGLPPEIGLYASIAPLVIYTIFGTSMTLAVGLVAVTSLMTASAIGELMVRGTTEYLGAAIVLALISGCQRRRKSLPLGRSKSRPFGAAPWCVMPSNSKHVPRRVGR